MGALSRILLSLGLALGMVLSALPAPANAATDTVDFEGSGWGHGVGMSQYGALAMATEGKTYGQILSHYFLGTSLQTLPSNTKIWVNLEENFTNKTLTVLPVGGSPAPVTVSLGPDEITADPQATIQLTSVGGSGCKAVVSNPDGSKPELTDTAQCEIDLSWYSWESGSNPPTKVRIAGCYLADWNVSPTQMRPCEYARGQLHLRSGSGGLDLVAEMLIDDYVLGISEIPYNWHIEAQKAQVVAARSYARARSLARGLPSYSDDNKCWCQVRDTTSDQRYVGWGHALRDNWVAATTGTARRVLTHPSSSLGVITAYYSSSSGGRTEHGHIKDFSNSQVEWLTSVDDSHAVDGTVWNPNASWTKTVTAASVAQALGFDTLTGVDVISRRPGSGSADQVKFTGIVGDSVVETVKTSGWTRVTFGLKSEYFDVNYSISAEGDELLLYKSNGTFQYHTLSSSGLLVATINSGSNYTSGWKSISSIDLNGDGRDEIMFYREDGLYRYYDIGATGSVGSPIRSGDDYTSGWDSITAVDLDGDGQDEMFFYREDGLYRYYDIASNGRIGAPIRSGDDYTSGWDSITAVDVDGDGQDEMFFYREDGLYRYYDIASNGRIGSPIESGDGYTTGWDAITAVDLDGSGPDEMFFYREDGLYRFYGVRPNGTLSGPIRSGSNFSQGWSVVTGIDLDGS